MARWICRANNHAATICVGLNGDLQWTIDDNDADRAVHQDDRLCIKRLADIMFAFNWPGRLLVSQTRLYPQPTSGRQARIIACRPRL